MPPPSTHLRHHLPYDHGEGGPAQPPPPPPGCIIPIIYLPLQVDDSVLEEEDIVW